MHNVERIGGRGRTGNAALLSQVDADRLGIIEGDEVEIEGEAGCLRLPVELTCELLPGVVAVPHGWGHAQAANGRASTLPGGNFNEAIDGGGRHVEPPSGQAVILGHPVQVRVISSGDRPRPGRGALSRRVDNAHR